MEVSEPLTDLEDIQAVAVAVRQTFVALGFPVTLTEVDVYDFYMTYSITADEPIDYDRCGGEIYTALATTLNTREFTFRSPVSDDEPSLMQLTIPRPIAEVEEEGMSIVEWLASLFRNDGLR